MQTIISIAQRLMSLPTAPFHEEAIQQEIIKLCAEHELDVKSDKFGNLMVVYKSGPSRRPIVLAAHMDHPGFDVRQHGSDGMFIGQFLGSVPREYFTPGLELRLHPGNTRAILIGPSKMEKEYVIRPIVPWTQSSGFAVWDILAFQFKDNMIIGRACDDLIGVTAALATLIELKRSRARTYAIAALSRAEEVGFHGALALAAENTLPKDSLIVSLETSAQMPPVRFGHGVIIRVGDRSSIFDSDASRFLWETAQILSAETPSFKCQRALMSGGTCEATAYQAFGYQTAGVCVALGNYHNCGGNFNIAPEHVSADDVVCMVGLLTEAARKMGEYSKITSLLPRRLNKLLKEARTQLARPYPARNPIL